MSPNLNLDAAWAAGFYEGEGSISACGGHKLILSVSQADPEPLVRFKAAMGVGAISGPSIGKSKLQKKPMYRFQANGERALDCLRFMWPMLSKRRQRQGLLALIRWMFRTVNHRAGHSTCARGHEIKIAGRTKRRECKACRKLRKLGSLPPITKRTAWEARLHGIREYTPKPIRVPPDTKTPREAVAWTFGVAPDSYRPQVET